MPSRQAGRVWNADVHRRFPEQALDTLPVRLGRPGAGSAAAFLQGAQAFSHCRVGVGEVTQSEAADHRVEGAVGERQALDVGFTKFNSRVPSSRQVDHAGREIDADGLGPTLGRRGGEVAGPRRHVQQAHAWGEAHRVEQGRDRQGRDLREEGAVARVFASCPSRSKVLKLLGILR